MGLELDGEDSYGGMLVGQMPDIVSYREERTILLQDVLFDIGSMY